MQEQIERKVEGRQIRRSRRSPKTKVLDLMQA